MERREALLSHPGGREGCKERAERARRCRDAPWADLMAVDMEVHAPFEPSGVRAAATVPPATLGIQPGTLRSAIRSGGGRKAAVRSPVRSQMVPVEGRARRTLASLHGKPTRRFSLAVNWLRRKR